MNYIELIIEVCSWVFFAVGLFFACVGVLGYFKLNDVYSRQHSAGLIDTGAVIFISLGLLLHAETLVVGFKIFFLALVLIYASLPICNAFINACLTGKVKNQYGEDLKQDGEKNDDN